MHLDPDGRRIMRRESEPAPPPETCNKEEKTLTVLFGFRALCGKQCVRLGSPAPPSLLHERAQRTPPCMAGGGAKGPCRGCRPRANVSPARVRPKGLAGDAVPGIPCSGEEGLLSADVIRLLLRARARGRKESRGGGHQRRRCQLGGQAPSLQDKYQLVLEMH